VHLESLVSRKDGGQQDLIRLLPKIDQASRGDRFGMFSGVFESSKHAFSHARNTSPRHQPLMRLLFHVSRGRHVRLNCWCDIFFWIQDSRAKYMSARGLVSLSSTSFSVLAAMHDAQTQGRAPRARRRRETYPLAVARHYILSGHGPALQLRCNAVRWQPCCCSVPGWLCKGLVTYRKGTTGLLREGNACQSTPKDYVPCRPHLTLTLRADRR
jgi:hypothetical protein